MVWILRRAEAPRMVALAVSTAQPHLQPEEVEALEMNRNHEYAVLGGYNRTKLGRHLSHVASIASGVAVFIVLSLADVAKRIGVNVNVPPVVMSLLGAGAIYAALYWLFDRYVWRMPYVARLLKLPDLSGTWNCKGVSEDRQAPNGWNGTITIVQSWDKIRVHLATSTSSSDSVAAALLDDSPLGSKLLYHYLNEPRPGEPELASHHGFAELSFSADGRSALGGYFNGRGRNTYGTMALTKEND